MYNFVWYAVGLSCGIAIGYEELEKKVRLKMRNVYREKNIKCYDEDGNEITYTNMIALLFPKKGLVEMKNQRNLIKILLCISITLMLFLVLALLFFIIKANK